MWSVAIPRWALPQPSPHSPPVLCSGAGGRAPTIHSWNLERFSALSEKEIIKSNIIPADALNPKPSFKSWGIFTLWVAELRARSQWEGGTRPTNADDRLESQPVILWRRRNTVKGYSNLLNRSWRLEGFKKILLASSEWLLLSPTMIVQYSSGETKYDLNFLVDKMLVPADRPSVLHFCLLRN